MTVTDFLRGDLVHVKGWGGVVFTVEGYARMCDANGRFSDGVEVRSGSLVGVQDPDDLTHATATPGDGNPT